MSARKGFRTLVRLVLESNYGGIEVDVCDICGAVVYGESRELHVDWHTVNAVSDRPGS